MKTPLHTMLKPGQSERGIALPIVIIFVVIMMLIGVTAIRNVTMGEKMAGNQRNQQLAFQAAEKALRYCENAVADAASIPTGGLVPVKQVPAVSPAPNLWEVKDNWSGATAIAIQVLPRPVDASNKPTDGLSNAPSCMVEDMKNSLALGPTELTRDESLQSYRITARATGGSDKAVVMLQSYLSFR